MPIHRSTLSASRPHFLGGGHWSLSRLNKINVLLGRNGSGKSQLLRALRDSSQESSHYVVPERTGEISFEPGLMVEVINSQGRRNRSSGNFQSNYRQEVVTRIQGYYTKRGTKPQSNINHDPDELLKHLAVILPDFQIRVKSESPFYELTRISDGTTVTSVSLLSSGESQLLSIGMDILTIVGMWELDEQPNRTLFIDEPDAHIHPDLQIKFADFLCRIEKDFSVQIFVATHSTTLLSALGQFAGGDVSVVYVDPKESEPRAEPFSSITKELSTILGGHLLMGPLFAAPVLLVEGDDDYRVWIQVSRAGAINACVLPCNGDEIKKYRKTLERLFEALSEDSSLRGYALIDSDKPLPVASDTDPQRHVKFIQLTCHETENLYLTDELLAELNHTWESACRALLEKAGDYGNKKEELLTIAQADRTTIDLKRVIHEVAEILDPKKLHWTVRLGKYLGKTKPAGQIADFLGSPVVDALWPEQPSGT